MHHRMCKLHHPPVRIQAASRYHIHYPAADAPSSRILLERIAICAAVTAFGLLEIWLTLVVLQGLLSSL